MLLNQNQQINALGNPPCLMFPQLSPAGGMTVTVAGQTFTRVSPGGGPNLPQVCIPLQITTVDEPIRQPKTTEIATIGTIDYAGWSDGSSNVMFFGGNEPLSTSLEGSLYTPTINVTDALTNQIFTQVQPTASGYTGGVPFNGQGNQPGFFPTIPMPNLTGFTQGDLIWAYIEGKITKVGPSALFRVDPAAYISPFGNVYLWPIISDFTVTRVPGNITRETFTMKLWLET